MSEQLVETTTRELWFEGPNYTADAVIVDRDASRILLIQRGDTGEWALPGGFVDADDPSSYHAAVREAQEEATITLDGYAPLVFRGIVDDPRNSETAWIETSAHLFIASSEHMVTGADDALDAQWFELANLPPLYASHRQIVERSLDCLDGKRLTDVFTTPDSLHYVDGGHMEYEKTIFEKDTVAVFCKQHNEDRYTDHEKASRSFEYLEKEAYTMAHLRVHGFESLPNSSILHVDTLVMDALRPEDGWNWRADSSSIDAYINDALQAFSKLESMPIPGDVFDIEPSHHSFRREGWQAFDESTLAALEQRLQTFLPRLTEESRLIAQELMHDLPNLKTAGLMSHTPEQFVFCHHDVRQSNLAWHPKHGTKLVDWSWAGLGEPGSDGTSLLVDLHKSGHDISSYYQHINPHHCLQLMGFWLGHSTWPLRGDDTVRFQQFVSALSAYEILWQRQS